MVRSINRDLLPACHASVGLASAAGHRVTATALTEGRWLELLDTSPMCVLIHDHRGRVLHANAAFARLLGYDMAEVLQMSAADIIHPDDRAERNRLAARLVSGELDEAVADRRLIDRGGRTIWVRAFKSAVTFGDQRLILVCLDDVREWRSRLDQLDHKANHDELTGLLNRAGLTKQMDRGLAEGRQGRLAVIDLNGLKSVNDAHGHAAGDVVLRRTAEQLRLIRTSSWLIGRLGGDEFVVVDWASTSELRPVLTRALAADIVVAPGVTTTLSASIGEAVFAAGALLDQVLQAADREMYRHKRARHVSVARSAAVNGPIETTPGRTAGSEWETINLPLTRGAY